MGITLFFSLPYLSIGKKQNKTQNTCSKQYMFGFVLAAALMIISLSTSFVQTKTTIEWILMIFSPWGNMKQGAVMSLVTSAFHGAVFNF